MWVFGGFKLVLSESTTNRLAVQYINSAESRYYVVIYITNIMAKSAFTTVSHRLLIRWVLDNIIL